MVHYDNWIILIQARLLKLRPQGFCLVSHVLKILEAHSASSSPITVMRQQEQVKTIVKLIHFCGIFRGNHFQYTDTLRPGTLFVDFACLGLRPARRWARVGFLPYGSA